MHDGDAITTIEGFCMPAGMLAEATAGCGAYPNILAAILGVVNGGRT
jgi:aerobic-type carbon monoxide dehydrogenase small subunit (CoxS/CutS family)